MYIRLAYLEQPQWSLRKHNTSQSLAYSLVSSTDNMLFLISQVPDLHCGVQIARSEQVQNGLISQDHITVFSENTKSHSFIESNIYIPELYQPTEISINLNPTDEAKTSLTLCLEYIYLHLRHVRYCKTKNDANQTSKIKQTFKFKCSPKPLTFFKK